MFEDAEIQAWLDSASRMAPENVRLLNAIETAQDRGYDLDALELHHFVARI